ncbi:MAG TPA: type II toxin-antitoxin system HigB family toxin [Blastocatellia bacterium]|nr:type II toxin-antitoxin system HigB family toxin [Blastocatellia bacterium]
MVIVTEERLVGYARTHPEASSGLLRWAAIVKVAAWKNFVELRRIFRNADQVGACVVFNIMGKNYRLIARIDYGLQAVTLKYFLTHAEYDRGKWKKDC